MSERDADSGMAPLTRRAMMAFGGKVATLSGLLAGLGLMEADAKKRKRRRRRNKKRKRPPGSFVVVAPQMTGDNEVPPESGDPNGQGSGQCAIKGNQICCTFQYTSEPDSPITAVQIHQGPPGEIGEMVVSFGTRLEDCAIADEGIAAQIKTNPSGFYANIHTEDFPDGAVRDQFEAG